MKTTHVQMNATLYVDVSQADLDVIWACAEGHYDSRVQGMTRQGGVLFGIKNQLGESESANVKLEFGDLDTMAKALEQACLLSVNHGKDMAARGFELWAKIHGMLRFINEQHSFKEVRA